MKEVLVMKKTRLVAALLILPALASLAKGGVGTIMNGSFEDDGFIENITVQEPNGWDVNIPNTDEFGGYVLDQWPTDGSYNLTLYSQSGGSFEANDLATVSQTVNFGDTNEVVFDLKLTSLDGTAWDPAKITAVLLIDGDVVWESNSVGTDVRDEYLGQVYEINDIYLDGEAHVLSLGLRVNLTIPFLADFFMSHWDFITLEMFCDGLGLVPGDIDRDCYVDMNDVRELGEVWLQETGAGSRYDLYPEPGDPNGLVSFPDYCVLANNWLASSYD